MSDDPTGQDNQAGNGGDSGYTPPATQDDLNRIIAERVGRERAKYADYGDLKSKASKFAEFEESQKTELQRAQDRATAAEQRVAQFEQERQISAWRAEVATASGVPADVLSGSTKEELEAHAEKLKPLLNPRGPQVPNPGGTPTTTASDERAFVRDLFGSG